MNLMFLPLKRYVDFGGRSRRSEYWLFVLFQVIAGIIFSVLHSLIDGGSSTGPAKIVETIFNLAILIPSIAVAVRRFHDIGRTGWWILFPYAVLTIALIVFISMKGSEMASMGDAFKYMSEHPEDMTRNMATLQPFLLWIFLPTWLASLVTFVFHVTDGTAGNNRFGADPKGRGAGSTANVF